MEGINDKYNLKGNEIDNLFKNATIVFDTSALLDLFYYSNDNINDIFDNIFSKLKPRLWIPQQVKQELKNNQKNVNKKIIQFYKDLLEINDRNKDDSGYLKKIDESIMKIRNSINTEVELIKLQLQKLITKSNNTHKHPFFQNEFVKEFKIDTKKLKMIFYI